MYIYHIFVYNYILYIYILAENVFFCLVSFCCFVFNSGPAQCDIGPVALRRLLEAASSRLKSDRPAIDLSTRAQLWRGARAHTAASIADHAQIYAHQSHLEFLLS